MIHGHYDKYRHEHSGKLFLEYGLQFFFDECCNVSSFNLRAFAEFVGVFSFPGLPLEILSLDFWVPGSTSRQDNAKFKNITPFKEILTTTDDSAELYVSRVTQECQGKRKEKPFFFK